MIEIEAVKESYLLVNGRRITTPDSHSTVAKAVADAFGITPDDLKKKGSEVPFSPARKIYVYLLVKMFGYKYEYISRLTDVNIGNITHYVNQVERSLRRKDMYMILKLENVFELL